MSRGDLSNRVWERLAPLLPPEKPKTGHPSKDHRTIFNGILWIARTGAMWRDLPEQHRPWRTVARHFYRWRDAACGIASLPPFKPKPSTIRSWTGRSIKNLQGDPWALAHRG